MRKIISVSLAKIEDAKLLLKIHNASVKGGYFNSKNLIVYKDHIEWFKKKLKSNSKIYIGKNSIKKKFGYVRFDEVKSNIFEVSLGNLTSFYGKGLGSLMLEKSIKRFKKKYSKSKFTRKKFPQSWVFNILKRESTNPPNEEIIIHNICNVELQPNICDV